MAHTCTHNGITYSVDKIIELSKGLDVKKYKVSDLIYILEKECWSDITKNKEVNISPLETYNRRHERVEFMEHVERAMKADLSFPIILNKEIDTVSDGAHRLLKAYITGEEFIKVIVFNSLPNEAIVTKE